MIEYPATLYRYRVLEHRVIDGDSLELRCDLGFNVHVQCSARLIGVDAPERFTPAGKAVTRCVEQWCQAANGMWFASYKLDKYGRSLGDLYIPGQHLSDWLLERGLVKDYEGGKREWTTQEQALIYRNALQVLGE